MFIVRVDFKNGLHLEFNYAHLETGEQCRTVCAAAQKNGDRCSIFDEAGRQADLDGSQIQAVQLVNLQEETVSIIRVGLIVQNIRTQLVPEGNSGRASWQEPAPAPSNVTPMIGGHVFSS